MHHQYSRTASAGFVVSCCKILMKRGVFWCGDGDALSWPFPANAQNGKYELLIQTSQYELFLHTLTLGINKQLTFYYSMASQSCM
jgi:hypothetical protein